MCEQDKKIKKTEKKGAHKRKLEDILDALNIQMGEQYDVGTGRMDYMVSETPKKWFLDMTTNIRNPLYELVDDDFPESWIEIVDRWLRNKYKDIMFDISHLRNEEHIMVRFSKEITPELIDELHQHIDKPAELQRKTKEMLFEEMYFNKGVQEFDRNWLVLGGDIERIQEKVEKMRKNT